MADRNLPAHGGSSSGTPSGTPSAPSVDPSAASPSAPPPARLPLAFLGGEPSQNLNAFRTACRKLARSQIGLSVASFDDVVDSRRKDMFRSLQRTFVLEDDHDHFSYVMQLMASQLKTWRAALRRQFLKPNMSLADMRRLRETPMNDIPLSHWEGFVDREASEKKMAERGSIGHTRLTRIAWGLKLTMSLSDIW